MRFIENRYSLSGLRIQSEFKGPQFFKLPPREQRFLKTGAADARTYGLVAGTPTLLFGAHGERMHAADERGWLPSVDDVAATLVGLVVSWCGVVDVDGSA